MQRAADAGVCLVVDAEQTYLQDSMDLMTLDLMRKYNKERPVVHNTYQCYLTVSNHQTGRPNELSVRLPFWLIERFKPTGRVKEIIFKFILVVS